MENLHSSEDPPKLELVAKLNVKQRQAVALLACGVSAVKVAEELKISRSTVERWKKDHGFDAALQAQSLENYGPLRARAMQLGFHALDTLEWVMNNSGDNFGRLTDQVRAADAVLRALGFGK